MKVLVLGGTGAMGIHLVENLTKGGIDTYVTSRRYRRSENTLHYLQGDAKDNVFLEKVLETKWDAIVDFMVYSTDEFKRRYKPLLGSTTQYIFISSARVYADSENPLTEDSARLLDVSIDKEYLSTDEYALTKARQEDILINSGKKNWTILRPYITYSENRLQLGGLEKEDWLYRALQGRTIIFPMELVSIVTTLTYGYDVSKGLMALIGNEKAFGNIFHITAGESYTWGDILEIYLKIIEQTLGFKPRVLMVSKAIFDLHSSLYQMKYDRMYNRKFNNDKISKTTDIENYTPIEKGLQSCLEEFLKKKEFKKINWKSEALKDKHCREFTPLHKIPTNKQRLKYLLFRFFPIN